MDPSNENCCASDGNSCSPKPGAFASRDDLEAAVNEWVSDATAAEAVHGPLPEWDVSSVDSLESLFELKGDFNGDISKWDTSKVRAMGGEGGRESERCPRARACARARGKHCRLEPVSCVRVCRGHRPGI